MSRKLAIACAAIAAICVTPAALSESTVSNVVTALTATPASFVGQCPAVIRFTGTITVTGNISPNSPVQIGYTFLRSDNATGPISYYTIDRPGTQTVSTTWTLGGAALPTYDGWIQLKAWPTRHLGFGYSFSPKATFHVSCAGPHGGPVVLPRPIGLSAQLTAVPTTYNGHCPAVINFNGSIALRGAVDPRRPERISYTFLRSDGATGPVTTYEARGPSVRLVNTTWTLGGPSLPSYSGWEQLKVWPTTTPDKALLSPRANFLMHCR